MCLLGCKRAKKDIKKNDAAYKKELRVNVSSNEYDEAYKKVLGVNMSSNEYDGACKGSPKRL